MPVTSPSLAGVLLYYPRKRAAVKGRLPPAAGARAVDAARAGV